MTIKTIYLARRNPDIAIDDFPRRWQKHAALAGRFPNITNRFTGVVQCIKASGGPLLPYAENDYDGVNLLTMRSSIAEDATTVWSDPDAIATMRPDELRVFDDYVENFSMVAEEQLVLPGPLTKTCVVTFLKRREGLGKNQFLEDWQSLQDESLRAVSPYHRYLRRLVANRIVLPPPPGYEYDLVSESWFENLDDVCTLYEDPDYRENHERRLAEICDSAKTVVMASRVVHAWTATQD